MSELFDKEVNALKESLKKLQGSCKLPHAHEKCAMKTKEKIKKQKERCGHKIIIYRRKHLIGCLQKQVKMIGTSFRSSILDTMKVPWGWFFKHGHMNGCH